MDYSEAEEYVNLIVSDLRDRTGLGDAFDALSNGKQQQIMETWIELLVEG